MSGMSQSWNTGGWLGVRGVVMLACLSASVEGQKYLKSYNKSNGGTKALYAFLGSLSFFLVIFSCYFCWKRVFPSNNEFLSLDLDDIRLERIDEREQFLQREMTGIQNKLTSYRRKKTDILIKKDVTQHLEENLDKYNGKGSKIYGDQWDSGTGGIKEMMSLPDGEARQLQIEAQNIVTQRKAEEERDLWHLWNTAKSGAKSAMGNIKGGMGGGKTDKKTDVTSVGALDRNGSEMRGADVMTDRVPTGRKSQATAIGAAAVAAGRTTRSAAAVGGGGGAGDPRFSSGAASAGPSGPSGPSDDSYAAYGKKNGVPTPPLDLSKISFPPSGVQRPGQGGMSDMGSSSGGGGRGGGGGGGGGSKTVSNSGPDPFLQSGGDNYNMDLGFTPQSQQRAAPLRPIGSSSSPAPARAAGGGGGTQQLPSMARRPAPPPINPMHSSSSPLDRLDQTHAAFTSGGAGSGGAGSPAPAVLKPPLGVRAPGGPNSLGRALGSPPRGPGGRPPPRGPPGMQLARPGFGTPGSPRPPPPSAGAPPRGTPRGPPPRAPSSLGGPLSPPPGVRGPPPRLRLP